MIEPRPIRGQLIRGCFIPLLLTASLVKAAPIAVESRSNTPGQGTYSQTSQTTQMVPFQTPIEDETPISDGIEAQYQLQLLQQEIMDLRGQVEELSFQLQRMRATQEDRYLELDRRLQTLTGGTLENGPGLVVGEEELLPPDEPGKVPNQEEKTLYETALELIRNRQYDLAITQLQAVIGQYPDGGYAPNAYYWLGEVYAAKPEPEYEKAREALAQVITFFPDHRKVPDAAFKLGKVYNLMGDCTRAKDILGQVIEQQKGRSVAKLAESYLRDKVNCE